MTEDDKQKLAVSCGTNRRRSDPSCQHYRSPGFEYPASAADRLFGWLSTHLIVFIGASCWQFA